MREFKTYHPIVNFTYFLAVIGFSMFLMHPAFLLVSRVCAIICSIMESGVKKSLKALLILFPFVLLMAVTNPLFNHKGATILAYFPSGNPLTAESVYYAIGAAGMLIAVIFHFSLYNKVMTSDKFIYLFGKVLPAISLVLSMILRFIPKMRRQAKEIILAQRALGRDEKKENIIVKCKRWVKVLSILITWSLENAVEISDSMKSRGYGFPGRTTYSIFRFEKRDAVALLWIVLNASAVIAGLCQGFLKYTYFPVVSASFTGISIAFEASYFFLMLTPVIIEVREACRWKALK